MLKANDFGNFLTLESCRKININDLVRGVNQEMKRQHLESVCLDSGLRIGLVTSRTRFGGKRYWFQCPSCKKRVGVLYQGLNKNGCRSCLGYKYKKSRYKGMVEEN